MDRPEALQLADGLSKSHLNHYINHAAAAKLRRLHAENESLRQIVEDFPPVEAELREVSDQAHRLEQQRDALLEALKTVRALITEAALTGFNPMRGDWPERLFASQQATSAAIKAVEEGK